MQRRTLLVALAVTAGGLAGAAPASAQDPAGCTNSRLDLDLGQDHDLVRVGDTINYTIDSDNVGANACHVRGVNINLQFPGLDGQPSATLQNKSPDRPTTRRRCSRRSGRMRTPSPPTPA